MLPAEMPALISDEMLDNFTVISSKEELVARIEDRYSGLIDRLNLYAPYQPGIGDPFWADVIGRFQNTTVGD